MKIDGFELEKAKENDFDYFVGCVKDNVLHSVDEKEKEFSDAWIDDTLAMAKFAFCKRPMLDEIFILKDKEKNVGMIWLGISRDQFTTDKIGYIMGIFVEENLRNKGIGKKLIAFAEDWCREKGLLSISLNVGSHNAVAKQFYQNRGFETQSEVMRKHLR